MTNTGNRRRRERATRNRADLILAEGGLYIDVRADLGHFDSSLAGAHERLRELLAGGAEELDRFRGLLGQYEAPSAETVSALLETARAPEPPVEVRELHYAPGADPDPARRALADHVLDDELDELITRARADGSLERTAHLLGWSLEDAEDALRHIAVAYRRSSP